MLRRIGLPALALALAVNVGGEAISASGTATAGSTAVTVSAHSVLIINDSTTYSVWVRVFWDGETPAAATAAVPSVEIKKGESMTFSKDQGVKAVSLICASGETAAYRIVNW